MGSKQRRNDKNLRQDAAENPRWFAKEDIHDLAKLGGDLLKKTVNSSMDIIKEVKDTLPKEASAALVKTKDELMKGFSSEMAKSTVSFAIDKVFAVARDHHLEFSIRLRKSNNETPKPQHDENRDKRSHSKL